MTPETRRVAPDSEFVLLYRRGVPTAKIAAVEGVAVTTVRYHLQIAAREYPGIRDEHKAALTRVVRENRAGLRNMGDVIAFFRSEGRLPTTGGSTPRERALGVWLGRRRQDLARGSLLDVYRDGLGVIPGWDSGPSHRERRDTRWQQRLEQLVNYRASGNDWPRHKTFATEQEHLLGVWLHVQRMNRREGKLDLSRELKLNELLPGWQEGRSRSRAAGPRSGSPPAIPMRPVRRHGGRVG